MCIDQFEEWEYFNFIAQYYFNIHWINSVTGDLC